MEDEAAWTIREVGMQKTAFLEEQRVNILKEAAYELGKQENKAASAVQILEQQRHQQYIWSSRVGVSTSKIHKAANYVPLPNY